MRKYRPTNWLATLGCASPRARIQRAYGKARKRLAEVASEAIANGKTEEALKAMQSDLAWSDYCRGAEEYHQLTTRGHARHYRQIGSRLNLYPELTGYTRDRDDKALGAEESGNRLAARVVRLLADPEEASAFGKAIAEYLLADWQVWQDRYGGKTASADGKPAEVTDCQDCYAAEATDQTIRCRGCNADLPVCQECKDWADQQFAIDKTKYTLVCEDCEVGTQSETYN